MAYALPARKPPASTLGDTLRELAPVIDLTLVPDANLAQIARTLETLPINSSPYFGFECRLGRETAGADFFAQIDPPARPGHEVRRGFERAERAPDEPPVWTRLRRFSEAWAEEGSLREWVPHLFLEFDMEEAPRRRIPSVFLHLVSPGDFAADKGAASWVLEQAVPLLRGSRLSLAVERTLRACIRALPAGAGCCYFGLMLSRPTDAVRVNLTGLTMDGFRAFLQDVAWSGKPDDAWMALSPFARRAGWFTLAIDAGEMVGPRLGVECRAPINENGAEHWAGFLDDLVDEGLCLPAQRDALLGWGLRSSERDGDGLLLDRISAALRSQGLRAVEVFRPSLCHIKISYQEDRPLGAKAYPAFKRSWALRPRAQVAASLIVDHQTAAGAK